MADIQALQDELDATVKAQEEAGQKADELRDQIDTERVKTFSAETVEEAEKLSINPRNFDTEENLQFAIEKVKSERPEDEEGPEDGGEA